MTRGNDGAAAASIYEPRRPDADAGAADARYRLLLADDSRAIRELLRVLVSLERELAVVGEAADGRAAVELAESTEADALVVDVAMPHLDGLEVVERLRTTRPALRILVYSGLTDPQLGRRARELGAHDYVVKGVRPDELVRRILAVCRAGAAA